MIEILLGAFEAPKSPILEIATENVQEEKIKQEIKHTVAENDTLAKIGTVYGVEWQRIFYKNIVIDHQDHLVIGTEITIPTADEELVERVLHPPLVNTATTTQNTTTQAVSSSYTINNGTPANVGYYDWGWCTYGAWQLTGWAGAWSHAKFWDDNARKSGHTVSNVPIVGSIFVDNGGEFGHVGVVIGVSGNMVTVKDMNYSGFGEWTVRDVPASRYVYIYPK